MRYNDIIMRTSCFLSSKPDAQSSLHYTICDHGLQNFIIHVRWLTTVFPRLNLHALRKPSTRQQKWRK